MRIIHLMQFFTGPHSPGTHQPRKLVKKLADNGHHIDVIACDMNAYSEQQEPAEVINGSGGGRVHVHRLAVARGMRKSLKARLRTYLGFAWQAMRFGLRLPRPDLVLASIQPFFSGLAGLRIARHYRVPLLLEVRDLWPDALEAKGAVTGWKARLMYVLAAYVYKHADRIVCLTPGIKTELVKKGLNAQVIDVFPNGFDPELFKIEKQTRETIRQHYGWTDKFVALYTGTHTEVTAVDVIVRAAAEIKDHPHIRFDLFGQGQTKPYAQALARELNVSNIYFHDPVPRSEIPGLIEGCDVGLMTLFTSRLEHIYFENKFIDFLGAGRAIVGALGGQQAEIINRRKAGKAVPAFDYRGLARLVLEAYENREEFKAMGINGKNLIAETLMLPDILDRYCQAIELTATNRTDFAAWEPDL